MTALLPISTVFKMVKSSREPLDVSKDVSTCEHTWMLSHLLAPFVRVHQLAVGWLDL